MKHLNHRIKRSHLLEASNKLNHCVLPALHLPPIVSETPEPRPGHRRRSGRHRPVDLQPDHEIRRLGRRRGKPAKTEVHPLPQPRRHYRSQLQAPPGERGRSARPPRGDPGARGELPEAEGGGRVEGARSRRGQLRPDQGGVQRARAQGGHPALVLADRNSDPEEDPGVRGAVLLAVADHGAVDLVRGEPPDVRKLGQWVLITAVL